MARELGLNPDKLGKIDNHKQEPWKVPLKEFIEDIYLKQFKKSEPETVKPFEQRSFTYHTHQNLSFHNPWELGTYIHNSLNPLKCFNKLNVSCASYVPASRNKKAPILLYIRALLIISC